MQTHIIIPTCGIDAVTRCISTLIDHTPEPYTVYLVINTDDDRRRLTAETSFGMLRGSRHRAVVCREKIGYVRAVNAGYRLAAPTDEDFIAVLNDDVEFGGDWLTPMLEKARDNPRIKQVGPSVKRVGRDGFWGKPTDEYRFVEGWCFLVSAGCFERRRIFDERFGLGYCEDMDLSISIQKVGYEIALVDLPIRHLRSQTFGRGPAREPEWTNNRKYLIRKHRLDR